MSENIPGPIPWWRGPIGMGLLGLALMVGGLKLSTWVVLTPREEEQARKLEEIRGMAEGKLRERLDEIAGPRPPYQWAGRLAVFAGLVLFVAAGVRMYLAPTPVEPPPVDEEEQEAEPPPAAAWPRE